MQLPDKKGYFGEFGGRFIPETLFYALEELQKNYFRIKKNPVFWKEFKAYLSQYAGRPTPLYYAENLSKFLKARIYLKREDLLHTGAHKINNTLGQALLAKKMGKKRLVAETGAGQHGVATATVAALFGFKCTVYMGGIDYLRQSLNVFRMKLMGTEVLRVEKGSRTLKDACSEAIRDWITNVRDTHYLLGSVVGPHPYPVLVRDFQTILGREAKEQILKKEGRLPDYLIACVGGGSNAIGLFYPFYRDKKVKFIGVEAAGDGLSTGRHADSLCRGRVGILHGTKSFLLQDSDGQVNIAHSIAAGLDYPGVGPEHSFYKSIHRAKYVSVNDREALQGLKVLSETEGIIPALEPSHAIAYLLKIKKEIKDKVIILCLSGRGDKDITIIKENMHLK